jgi:hypothetical protein
MIAHKLWIGDGHIWPGRIRRQDGKIGSIDPEHNLHGRRRPILVSGPALHLPLGIDFIEIADWRPVVPGCGGLNLRSTDSSGAEKYRKTGQPNPLAVSHACSLLNRRFRRAEPARRRLPQDLKVGCSDTIDLSIATVASKFARYKRRLPPLFTKPA